jgi:CheY-like chemotaxis protein
VAVIQGVAARNLVDRDGKRPRVLYAEDQATSRVVTKAILERMGLDVDAVEDGELALDRASRGKYDVILLDIEMPVMDGVAAARGIRALGGETSQTPILALSAFLADSTELSQWRDAFDQAIPKPANGNELRNAIHKALQDRPERIVVKDPAKPGALSSGLQAALPKGAWARFVTMAAEEAAHYVNVAETALAFRDDDTFRRCLHSLRGLALNFGAEELAIHVHMLQMGAAGDAEMKKLTLLVRNWQSAN